MQIIDGYCDVPNIYADDIGEYNISLFGSGDYVLSVGEKLGYELISNNELKIKDGIFLTQGRRGIIKKGSSEICIIENGTQAEKRNDLVVIEYARDEATQVESHSLKVIKGTPGEEATDPETVTGDISSGAVLHQMPLYRVRLDGLNVVAVEPLFEIGKVSPETVDPMTATEEGFAADAKLTGDALRDLSANLPFSFGIDDAGNYGYIKEGADSVTPFKVGNAVFVPWSISTDYENRRTASKNVAEYIPAGKTLSSASVYTVGVSFSIITGGYVHSGSATYSVGKSGTTVTLTQSVISGVQVYGAASGIVLIF